MRFLGKKIVSGVLVLSFIATPLLLPNHVKAQDGGGVGTGMAGCLGSAVSAAGGLVAIGLAIWDAIAVPAASKATIANTGATATGTIADIFIQCVLNALVKVIKEALIAEITASIIRWINSGFEGGPDFITNPGDFFTGVGDRAAGGFIQEIGAGFLCQPFRIDLQIALALDYYAKRRAPTCTLSRVIGNIDNFYLGLGGEIQTWGQFIAIAANPYNDPVAAFNIGQAQIGFRVGNEVANWGFDLSANSNFLGVKTCVDERPNPGDPDSTICYKYDTLTPGHSAQVALDKVTGTGFYQLEIADAIDEIIGAFLSKLMQEVLVGVGGLLGTTQPNSQFNGETYLDQIDRESVRANIQVIREELVRQIQTTLTALRNALNSTTDPAQSVQIQAAIRYLEDLLVLVINANSLTDDLSAVPPIIGLRTLQQRFLHPPAGITYTIPDGGGPTDDVPPPPDTDPPAGP